MKNKIIITLTVLTTLLFFAGSYFSTKQASYKTIIKEVNDFGLEATQIAKLNQWIKKEPSEFFEDLDEFPKAQEDIYNLEKQLKAPFNTTIIKVDKEIKGIVTISLESRIFRDDIPSLLKLYKFQIPNGYVDFQSVEVRGSYVISKLNLIKFYKGAQK